MTELLNRVLAPEPPPFALLHRPEWTGRRLDVLAGELWEADKLADIPVADRVLAVIPYRQLRERGLACSSTPSRY